MVRGSAVVLALVSALGAGADAAAQPRGKEPSLAEGVRACERAAEGVRGLRGRPAAEAERALRKSKAVSEVSVVRVGEGRDDQIVGGRANVIVDAEGRVLAIRCH